MTELKPGRELDALVAQRIMGWTEINGDEGLSPLCSHPLLVPRYSTCIEAAWEVVKKFTSLGWDISVVSSGEMYTADQFHAEFDPRYCEHGDLVIKGAFSAPHAISLAALAATPFRSDSDRSTS